MLCRAERCVLAVVDMQTRLAQAMVPEEFEEVLRNTRSLLISALRLSIPVLVTQQYPKGLGNLHPDLNGVLPAAARIIDKTQFSCCGAPGYREALSATGRRQVVVVGMEAHVCVLQTAAALRDEGYEVFVVEDAVCSRSRTKRDNALARLRHAGIAVSNVESVLFEWLRDAGHEHFKELSKLIR